MYFIYNKWAQKANETTLIIVYFSDKTNVSLEYMLQNVLFVFHFKTNNFQLLFIACVCSRVCVCLGWLCPFKYQTEEGKEEEKK